MRKLYTPRNSKKYLHFLFFLVFVTAFTALKAQPAVEWTRLLGDSTQQGKTAQSLVQVKDGYIIATTSKQFVDGPTGFIYSYACLYKTGFDGKVVWRRDITPARTINVYIIPDGNGGVFYTYIFSPQSSNGYTNRIIIGDMSATGDVLWQKEVANPNEFTGYGFMTVSLVPTNDGGFMLNTDEGYQILGSRLLKYSAKGVLEWQRKYGGDGGDFITNVFQLKTGYIFFAATMSQSGDITNPHGGADIWMVRIDDKGNIVWQKSIGGSDNDNITGVTPTRDGGFFLTAYSRSADGDVGTNYGNTDSWNMKLDSAGNFIWKKVLGGSENEYFNSAYETSDGGYVAIGFTESSNGDIPLNHGQTDIWAVKFSPGGNIVWNKTYGSSGYEASYFSWNTHKTQSNVFYIASSSFYYNDGDMADMVDTATKSGNWLLKIGENGNILWQKFVGQYYFDPQLSDAPDSSLIMGSLGSTDLTTYDIKHEDYVLTKLCAGFEDTLILTPGSVTFCEGDSTTFKAKPGFARYEWNTGETTQNIVAKKAGKYWVKVFNSSGCSAIAYPAMTAIVNPAPSPGLNITRDTAFCTGDSAVFIPVEKNGAYLWVDGATSYTRAIKNTGNVYVKITNSYGCSIYSDTIHVTAQPLPGIPTITYSGNKLVTQQGYAHYAWYRNNQLVPDTTAYEFIPVQTGTYTVVVTNKYGCSQISQTFLLSALPVTIANFTGTEKGNEILLQWNVLTQLNVDRFLVERCNDGVNFAAIGSVPAEEYKSVYNYADKNASATTAQLYYRLKILDKDGQFAFSKIVTIATKNNAPVYCSILKNTLTISGLRGNESIRVYNIAGQVVAQAKATGAIENINLNSSAAGMYYVKIITTTTKAATIIKVVK